MLPCQVGPPLRWMLRPCFRLSTSAHTCIVRSEKNKSAQLPTPCFPSSLLRADEVSSTSPFPSHLTNSRSFSTSCSLCDAVQHKTADSSKEPTDAGDEPTRRKVTEAGQEKNKVIFKSSFEQLMKLAPDVKSALQACSVLQRLGSLYKEGKVPSMDGEALLQDERLNPAVRLIDKDIHKLGGKVILDTLQSLYSVTDKDVHIITSLLMQMIWLLRRLHISMVMQTLQLHLGQQESSARRRVVEQCMVVLDRRWVELSSVKDIVFLMYTVHEASTSKTLMEKLEERALDMIETASPKELYRIVYLLSKQRHRNTPLIRAAVYHLNKSAVSSLSTIQLSNLVYALCVLNVYDETLLTKVSGELAQRETELTPRLSYSLMASFSRLRWKEDSVLQILLNVLNQHLDSSSEMETVNDGDVSSMKTRSLDFSNKVNLLLSLANLNVDSTQSRELAGKISRLAEVQNLQESSPLLWLDVVWSQCILGMADSSSVASVLSEDFLSKLPSADSFQSVVNQTKVNNINCVARLDFDDYNGPLLSPDLPLPDAKVLQKGERIIGEKVVSALTNMAPLNSYTNTSVTAPGAYLVDAVFYVDKSGKPVPLSQTAQNSNDCHRVALKVLDFPDLTLPTSDLTGLHAMAERHLRQQGFIVVQVNHSEITSKTTVVEIVNLLQQKVKDALKINGPAPPSS